MIVIKDFKMPKDCDSCPLGIGAHDISACVLTGEQFPKPKKRHHHCPLHEDGCDVCKYKYRCSKRNGLVKAIIFGCKDFKKEEQ